MSDPHPPPGPDDLFDDYIRRRDAGEPVDFEALCRAHPAAAAALRRHEAEHRLLDQLLPGPLDADDRAADDVRGADDEATVDLESGDDEFEAGTPIELLERLRGQHGRRYEVLREIGRGGMGIVLRVRDTELRRKLAMKVALAHGDKRGLGTQKTDTRALSRFLEEAQITSQIDHPGIVPVHEIGIDPHGRVFFTMKLVRGENLRTIFAYVRDGVAGWNPVRAVLVLQKVCEAMSYAHGKKVIHRDLKPANVMVGRFGEVYVMDWGLARVLGRADVHDLRIQPAQESASRIDTAREDERDSEPDSPLVTMDGQVVGTPAYMAPEQAKGQLDRVGPHSDVYSVGAMLYHLISGEVPYVPTGARLSTHTLLARVIDGPPKSLHEFGRKAPAALVAICEKAMARAIEDRYPSMQALGDDLRAYVEGRVVSAYETGTWAETRLWVRRNRGLAASLAAALLLLAAGMMIFVAQEGQARRLEQEAQKRADVLITQAGLDELERRGREWDFEPPTGNSTAAWWRNAAHDLLAGLPDSHRPTGRRSGLAAYRRHLENLRADSVPPDLPALGADILPFASQAILDEKQCRLPWYSSMLRHPDSAFPAIDEATMSARCKDHSHFRLNQLAWSYVDPRYPQHGHEAEGLWLSRMALTRLEAMASAVKPDEMKPDVVERTRAGFRHTLAWALYRNGRFAEALQQMSLVVPVLGELHDQFPPMAGEIQRWTDGSAQLEHALLQREVEQLTDEREAWTTFRTTDASDLLWHAQLTRLVAELEALERRLHANDRVARVGHLPYSWPDAIAAIRANDQYGGIEISPQVDLVPVGQDPVSRLWEFAHLPSGDVATRRRDGTLSLTVATGLVFVLLPEAHAAVRDGRADEPRVTVELRPFFLSKYEMTQAQWIRLRPDWTGSFHCPDPLNPANILSHDDAVAALESCPGWLRLPTCAQWEYACWGLESPGDDWGSPAFKPLTDEANLGTGARLRRIGAGRGNDHGLHDMFGNVQELCADDSTPVAAPRPGDGRRRAGTLFEVGIMGGSTGAHSTWSGVGLRTLRENDIGLRPARPLMR